MTHAYGKSLLPSTVGFDRLLTTIDEFDRMFGNVKTPTYPPYNIVKFDDDNYEIQIAVAGFDKNDIVIETNRDVLTVNGVSQKSETEVNYLHHGLAARDFRHTFRLSDTVIVNSADIVNGVLKISLENVIPEAKKPRKIPIGKLEQTLLVE
jgi:molecular chaperone IbpA